MHVAVSGEDVVSQLLLSAFVVLLENSEVTLGSSNGEGLDEFLHGTEHKCTRGNHF